MPSVIWCKHGQLKIVGEVCDESCGPEFVKEFDRKFLKSIGVKSEAPASDPAPGFAIGNGEEQS